MTPAATTWEEEEADNIKSRHNLAALLLGGVRLTQHLVKLNYDLLQVATIGLSLASLRNYFLYFELCHRLIYHVLNEWAAIRARETQYWRVEYLLVAEPHLPPRVSRDIHAAQKDPLLVTIVQDGRRGLGLQAPHQFRLDWGVILFVDNIIDAVTVNQQVFLQQQTFNEPKKANNSPLNGLKASKAFIQADK